jgi:hypothetical protein
MPAGRALRAQLSGGQLQQHAADGAVSISAPWCLCQHSNLRCHQFIARGVQRSAGRVEVQQRSEQQHMLNNAHLCSCVCAGNHASAAVAVLDNIITRQSCHIA